MTKRSLPKEYNPEGKYDFQNFKHCFNKDIKSVYENMHNTLLYTNEKQKFDEAIDAFEQINKLLIDIDE